MPKQVIEVLRQMEALREPANPFIFPGFRKRGTHMSEATPLKALERMGYGGKNKENGHVVTHGFRSTASTILNEAGFNPDAVERQATCRFPRLPLISSKHAMPGENRLRK